MQMDVTRASKKWLFAAPLGCPVGRRLHLPLTQVTVQSMTVPFGLPPFGLKPRRAQCNEANPELVEAAYVDPTGEDCSVIPPPQPTPF